MKKKLTPLVLSLGIIGLAGCGNGEDGDDSNGDNGTSEGNVEFGEVLSSSDAGDVTVDDILNQLGTEQVGQQTFQLTLDQILKDRYSEDVDEEQIQSDIDTEIENMGGEEQFEMALQQQGGMTVEGYRDQVVTSAYHDQFFTDQFEISDEEARENTREASHILVSVGQEGQEDGLSEEEAEEKAQDLISQLEDGDAEFGELASEESDDPGSASNDGELGYVQQGQMVEEFENALFDLEQGEMTSEPVQSQHGFHIIQRHDEENIDEELDNIKSQMANQRVQENPDEVLNMYNDLLEEYNVEFENEEIQQFVENTYLSNGDEESSEGEGSEGNSESSESDSEE